MKAFFFSTLSVLLAALSYGQTLPRGLSFVPDDSFTGSSLTHWQQLGTASWHARQGEVTATVKPGGSGWLLMDRPYQDVGFHALFKCSPGSEAGLLFRTEKKGDSLQGVFVSIKDETAAAYRVTLDKMVRSCNGRLCGMPAALFVWRCHRGRNKVITITSLRAAKQLMGLSCRWYAPERRCAPMNGTR